MIANIDLQNETCQLPDTDRRPWEPADDSKPRRRTNVHDFQVDMQAVIFDPQTHRLFHLNETALALWRRCDGRETIRGMAKSLQVSYSVPYNTAIEHVQSLVASLETTGLLMEQQTRLDHQS